MSERFWHAVAYLFGGIAAFAALVSHLALLRRDIARRDKRRTIKRR